MKEEEQMTEIIKKKCCRKGCEKIVEFDWEDDDGPMPDTNSIFAYCPEHGKGIENAINILKELVVASNKIKKKEAKPKEP